MTLKQPPAIASWCLVNLSDPDEGLLGDVFEEYQHRQSPWWYWRQVAIAIVVGFARNVWTHKLETLQALFTVQAALGIGARAIIEPLMLASGSMFGRGWSLPPASWTDGFVWLSSVLWFFSAMAIGMMVARLHPARRATMTWAIVIFPVLPFMPEWYRMASNVIDLGPRFLPYLINSILFCVNISAGLTLGSLLMRASRAAANAPDLPQAHGRD